MVGEARRSRTLSLIAVGIAPLIAVVTAIVLTFIGHFLICLGIHPESISTADWAAPFLGMICGAAFIGILFGRRSFLPVAVSNLITMSLWLVAWCYLMGRMSPALWWSQAISGLTWSHGIWWSTALVVAQMVGMAVGNVRRSVGWKLTLVASLSLAAFAVTVIIGSSVLDRADARFGSERQIADGMTVRITPPVSDGTDVRLFTFDLKQQPGLSVGLYDADSDDSSPGDDRTATWQAQSASFVLNKLIRRSKPRNREILCVFNAGFFSLGNERGFVGSHVAPIVVGGRPLYNVRTNKPGDWTFGVRRQGGRAIFDFIESPKWNGLSRFDTAICYVRPLRIGGKSVPLGKGAGVTRLRCSRTSIGWTSDSSRFYVLIVRDPDGEMAGVRQMEANRRQTGGWDVSEVQRFWERAGVPYAALLDGGDSTQVAYLSGQDSYTVAGSGYLLSRTLGYVRDRPLRFFVPMLPPAQSHNGVMNYLYIEGPR